MQLCSECNGTGAILDRYCSCPAAVALRESIQSIPGLKEIQDRIDRMLDEPPAIFVGLDGPKEAGSVQVAKRPWRKS